MIPQDFIHLLLDRTDIVEVIDRHVPLKKKGANYTACCPFHNEKTPSFTVSPAKQFYHCFGCGAHGTAITFLMQHAGYGFVDAVRELAGRVGLTVPDDGHVARPEDSRRDALFECMEAASRFYRAQLKASATAIEYLKRRGLNGEAAARFGLGHAPDDWQGLTRAVPDYNDSALEEAGLVIAGEGRRYDRFRDRIMFPIRNERGRVVAFGGRVLGAGEPKYLNSPETPLFHKSRELYGLFENRRAIQAAGRAIVVEGYMDVVMLAQHGVENALATLGTAITPDQVGRLFRLVDDVLFAFDGDAAGRRAAWRALENALPQLQDGKRAAFLFLPEGEDPDSYVRGQGAPAFHALCERAMPLSDFLFQELGAKTDLASQEGRVRLATLAEPLIARIAQAPMLARALRARLAQLSGLAAPAERRLPIRSGRPVVRDRTASRLPSPEQVLLQAILYRPDWVAELPDPSPLPGEAAATLATVREVMREHPELRAARDLIEYFRDRPERSRLETAAAASLHWEDAESGYDIEADFRGALASLAERLAAAQARALASKRPSEISPEERSRYLEALRNKKLDRLKAEPDA